MDSQINKLPIGYWVKKVDNLLTKTIEAAHIENNLSKKGWQVLNTIIVHKEVIADQLQEAMTPFMKEEEYKNVLTDLTGRGFISLNGTYKATTSGIEFHSEVLKKQTLIRNKVMQDISQEEYEITVTTLQRIIKNLGRV